MDRSLALKKMVFGELMSVGKSPVMCATVIMMLTVGIMLILAQFLAVNGYLSSKGSSSSSLVHHGTDSRSASAEEVNLMKAWPPNSAPAVVDVLAASSPPTSQCGMKRPERTWSQLFLDALLCSTEHSYWNPGVDNC